VIHQNLREIKMIGEMASAVDEQRQPNITGGMVFSFLADLQKIMNGVAEGLEAHQISASEYGFIGRQMLAASLQDQDDAGSTADGVWAEIQKAVDSGQMRSSSGGSSNIDVELELERLRRELVPDANRELARRNASQLAPDRSTIIMELIFSSIMSEASRGMAVNVQKSGDGIMIDTGNNNPRDAALEDAVPAQ
jgi:hypothetical protein